MALDIFGPASAPGAVTVRPGETRSFTATDSFFKDCSDPVTDDGTEIQAAWMNQILANIRALARTNGQTGGAVDVVTEDNADDSLLRKAVQHIVQRGQTLYSADGGTADALVFALTPAAAEYKTGMVFYGIKSANANATATPTVNLNALGLKTIKDRRGQPIVAGDLPANAVLPLFYDGTNVRFLGIVSADFGVNGSLRNVQKFQTSTRVSMTGNAGNAYTVLAWTPGAYVKQSATSQLLIWATFSNFTPGPTGSTSGILTIGGTPLQFIPSNNNLAQGFGQGTIVQSVSGLAAGSLSQTLQFKRSDSTDWTGVFCFNSTESAQYPPSTTSTIVLAELGV